MLRRLFRSRRKRSIERDLNDEIQQYIAQATEEKIAGGLSPEEARRQALLEFGGVDQVKELMRTSRSGAWFDAFLRDVQYAGRIFLKQPSFSILVILTAALGIAAATTSFSVVDAVFFRPLPYKDADRLVQIWGTIPALRNDPVLVAIWDQFAPGYQGYQEFEKRQTTFEQVGAFLIESSSLLGNDARHIEVGKAEATVFRILGVPALLGRLILASDEQPDSPPVAVLGYDMWMQDFGGDPNVLGRRVLVQSLRRDAPPRDEYLVVGVLPQGFRLPVHDGPETKSADMWTAVWNRGLSVLPSQDFEMLGTLKPDTSIASAEKEADAIFSALPPDPSWPPELHMKLGAKVIYWREQEAAPLRKPAWLVFAASGLLLLIACGNVANLLLDRTLARRHELTLRSALGASRSRIVMHLLIESTMLSAAGGFIGAIFAGTLIRALIGWLPIDAPYGTLRMDSRVLFFAILSSIVTGVLFGLLPALIGAKTEMAARLKDSGTNRGSHRNGVQRLLIVAEISISFVLLVAAALITRSLIRVAAQNPGFRTEHLLTFKLDLPASRYGDPPRIETFYRDLLSRLRSLPGVLAVTGRNGAPFTNYHSVGCSSDIVPEGTPKGSLPTCIEGREVLPNYFEVLGIPVMEGRTFADADAKDGPSNVAIVNKAMALAFWRGRSAINQRLGKATVVGVIDNAKEFSLDEKAQPFYYMPGRPYRVDLRLILRTSVKAESIASAIRHEVRTIDPELPVDGIKTMEDLIAASQTTQRDRTILIGLFAVAAVILVLVGLYGVISRGVGQRERELGIRIAIGARPVEVLWLVLRQSLFLASTGVLIGFVAALAAMRFITSFLFGITATDVSSYSAIAASLIAMCLAAAYLPARRATRIDPAECFRSE